VSIVSERDWVMRAVRRLVEALARVLKLRTEQKPVEERAALDALSIELLGMELGPLLLVDPASAASVLGRRERVRVFLRLVRERVKTEAAAGDAGRARTLEAWADELDRLSTGAPIPGVDAAT